jgi:two-component system LytT family response regulator
VKDPLKILIVDDEPEARELLKFMLQEEKGLTIAGMAGNVDDAFRMMKEETPDLVFLDIQMPDKDGFYFIELISQSSLDPGIVFITSHNNYVIQAIRNSVFDYILKPVRREELLQSIERFRKRRVIRPLPDYSGLMEVLKGGWPGKIKLNTRSGYILIHPPEVVYCQADGNYTHIQLVSGTREMTTQNLGTIEELLRPGAFFRASRSYLVNLKYLARVDRKNCLCILEYPGNTCSIKIPSQKIRLLESSFS